MRGCNVNRACALVALLLVACGDGFSGDALEAGPVDAAADALEAGPVDAAADAPAADAGGESFDAQDEKGDASADAPADVVDEPAPYCFACFGAVICAPQCVKCNGGIYCRPGS